MSIDFKIAQHSILPNVRIVEILLNKEVVGVIYPEGENGIKVVSAHFEERGLEEGFEGEVIEDDGSTSWPPIPSFRVRFKPQKYIISGNRIIKLS